MKLDTNKSFLEPEFISLWEWKKAYRRSFDDSTTQKITIRLERPYGMSHDHRIGVHANCSEDAYTLFERTIKFLLWQVGASRVLSDAPKSFVDRIASSYCSGPCVFDSQISGGKRYDLATDGRRLANATYFQPHSVDACERVTFAVDLTELFTEDKMRMSAFLDGVLQKFITSMHDQMRAFYPIDKIPFVENEIPS